MYNIVFLDIDKIDDDFESSKEKIDELTKLVLNIESINPECINYIQMVSKKDLNKQLYKISLLQAFFKAQSLARNNIVVGPVISDKEICYPNGAITQDDRLLSEKQKSVVDFIEKEMTVIVGFVHITNGVDFFLHDNLKKYKNIVFKESYDGSHDPIDIDNSNGKDFTYLLSTKSGIEGYNDCFNTYFEHKNAAKLTKEIN